MIINKYSSITGTSPSDCIVSYSGHWLGGLTPTQGSSWCILQLQMTGPQDTSCGGLTPPQKYSRCILQPQPTGQRKLVLKNCMLHEFYKATVNP